jgi:hypothetical protein
MRSSLVAGLTGRGQSDFNLKRKTNQKEFLTEFCASSPFGFEEGATAGTRGNNDDDDEQHFSLSRGHSKKARMLLAWPPSLMFT